MQLVLATAVTNIRRLQIHGARSPWQLNFVWWP